ncbi:MAG: hypothetical protein K0R61_145 [Microvirga sp.]|nr:hypothetical protein [Microvirga sp.]
MTSGAAAAGSPAVSLPGDATADTKASSWTEVIASTPAAGSMLLLQIGSYLNVAQRSFLIDIAIGGAGAETVLIANAWFPVGSLVTFMSHYLLFCCVPKGSRLSARCQSNSSDEAVPISLTVFSPAALDAVPTGPVVPYGVNLATTNGLPLVPASSAEGNWAQLTAATSCRHTKLLLVIGKDEADVAMTTDRYVLDIGMGGSGAEKEIILDIPLVIDALADQPLPGIIGPLDVAIPKGSRLAARLRGNSTQTGTQIVAYGMG